MHMPYKYAYCQEYTSAQIESWIEDVEVRLQHVINDNGMKKSTEMLQEQVDGLRADLILKKQEEAKKTEMKQLLNRILLLVDET